ncbi:MAG: acyl carrier protein [Alphaproteobacteria bacterium]
MDTLDSDIQRVFKDVWATEKGTEAPKLEDDTVLLESGLDSIGFAVFVSQLEEELGYDPFTLSDEAYYPQTFKEFVDFYRKHRPDGLSR